jgi:hypothetical protein
MSTTDIAVPRDAALDELVETCPSLLLTGRRSRLIATPVLDAAATAATSQDA